MLDLCKLLPKCLIKGTEFSLFDVVKSVLVTKNAREKNCKEMIHDLGFMY